MKFKHLAWAFVAALFALIVVYGIGAELVLVQIISIEHGAPIISSGSIYEDTKYLARI